MYSNKIIVFSVALWMNISMMLAQNMGNSTGELVVESGSYLVITGDLDNSNNGDLTVNGTLSVTGDITSTPGTTITWGGSSAMLIKGGTTQSIDGVSSLRALTIENSSEAQLAQHTTITSSLILTSGKLTLGNFNLTMGNSATISGASTSDYINASGAGALVRQVAGSAVSFPVGTASGYNPLSLTNSGTSDAFSVRVVNRVLQDGSSGSVINSRVVDRTWSITEAVSGALSLNATFQWAAADELSNFDRANTTVYHYTGGAWLADGTTGSVSGSDPYAVTVTGITSLSPFSVGDDQTVFPVEWLSFTAVPDDQMIRLNWATASELNSDYFAVERRFEQGNWQELGIVPAAGYSNETREYEFRDQDAFSGRRSYRLKQVDMDGTFSYGDQVEVEMMHTTISYFPNPFSQNLTIRNPWQNSLTAKIIHPDGRMVRTFEVKTGDNQINVSDIPSGIYLLQLSEPSGWIRSVSVVKE